MTDKVTVRIIKDTPDGVFKKGEKIEFAEDGAAMLVKEGYAEYIKATINREHAQIHLAILGKRDSYQVTAKNYATGKVDNQFLYESELIEYAEKMNKEGYCVWVSLNPKEKDGIDGVTALSDFWLDIDRPKATKDSKSPATQEELQEALTRAQKLKKYIEKEYAANGFLAKSGNGFHIHFPLPITPIEAENRQLVNKRVNAFAKKVSAQIKQEIDNTYDINRKTTLIGSLNLKFADHPIQTSFEAEIFYEGFEKAIAWVNNARNNNETLLQNILETEPETTQKPTSTNTGRAHPKLERLFSGNLKLKDYYNGDFQKHTGKDDRSEAEMYVICSLIGYGFTDEEIKQTMENCKIGKWNEANEKYQEHTLTKAHEHIAIEEAKQKQKILEKFAELVNHYPKAEKAYYGNYQFGYDTTKDADLDILKVLIRSNYPINEIRAIMDESKAGYWKEAEQKRRDELLTKARREIEKEKQPEQERGKIESQADRLVKLCENENVYLFFDQHTTPYARVRLACDTCDTCDTCDIYGIPTTQDHPKLTLENGKMMDKEAVTAPQNTPLCDPKVCENTVNIAIPQDTATPKKSAFRDMPKTKLVTMQIRSKQFRAFLSYLMWDKEQKAPGADAISSAINVLMGKALREGRQHTLYNRVAPAVDGIWLDMADQYWRAIHITAQGWEIVNEPPIIFRRYNHQKPLADPAPKEQGNAWKLLDYTNIETTDEKTRLSFLCTAISYIIPLISHPVCIVYGPQGTAKSSLMRFVRQIIDPSSIELLTMQRNNTEMIQLLEHHWIAPFDNITFMPTWASDTFCRAATGGGFSKRELYSDDDDTIYNFKRCVMLNGINIAAQRGDLLDRAILVGLSVIPPEKRQTEEELNSKFEKDLPAILTGFLNVLVEALRIYPTVKLSGYQRLADFNKYGVAIAQALGKTAQEFIDAYGDKVAQQNEEALNADPVALAILNFCIRDLKRPSEVTATWKGQPSELYTKLTTHAQQIGVNVNGKTWPKAPNALTRRINEVAPALQAAGCTITVYQGTPRQILIDATNVKTEQPKQPDYIHIKALSITRNDESCDKCHNSPIDFAARNKDGKEVFLCSKCAVEVQ